MHADRSDARKAAEAFIAVGHVWDGPTCIRAVEIITSLLAEQPEAGVLHDDIWTACGCPNPNDCEHVFYEFAPASSPARDEVREAAEEWAAAEAEYDAVPAYSRDTDAFGRNMFRRQSARRRLLAALSSPPAAPAKDEVREAAAKLDSACRRKEALSWCGRKACDEVWSSACTLLAALAARGERGE